jgi:hypothetical protein
MKQQLLMIILLLATVPCFSQTIQTQGSPNRATRYLGGLQADSTLVVPVRNRDSIYPNLPYKGRVQLNSETNVLEYHNGEEWVVTGVNGYGGSGEAVKIEDEIDGYTARVGFPATATADSYWVFPQASSSAQFPIYVPLDINGSVASSGGSVVVGIQGVLNASTSDGMVAGYDRLNFYIPDSSLDIYPNIFTYNSTPDEANFTTVGGVRNDGRTFGPDAIADNDYVTKSQLDESSGNAISPILSGIASYGEDYSANYTDRSLVDKGYVDEVVANNEVNSLKKSVGEYFLTVNLSESLLNNAVWEFPQTDGSDESPTYIIRSVSGQQANSNGELELDLQSAINYSYSSPDQPIAANNRLHFYVTPSEEASSFITWYNYDPSESTFFSVAGIKYDGRAYGPIAVDPEDYIPLSQVENLILDATNEIEPNIDEILANGSTSSIQNTIDLRSDTGFIFAHNTTGNKLELNSNGLEYNGNPLVDKSTLLGYVASATNISFTAHKTASELNTAYPGVYEGFMVKCPNAGVIYIKTALPGQWQLIGATTLNP